MLYWYNHIFFIHLSIGGPLGCPPAAANTAIQVIEWTYVSIYLT